MRLKIAIAAVLGMLLGLVPLTGIGQAGAAGTANVRIVHSVLTYPGLPGAPVDIYVNGAKAVTALAYGEVADAVLPTGTHSIVACTNPSCTTTYSSGSLTVVADNNYTVAASGIYIPAGALGGGQPASAIQVPLQSFINESTPTSFDSARIQLNNGIPASLAAVGQSICINGVALAGTVDITAGETGVAEIPAGTHDFSIQAATQPCSTTPTAISFPAGTAFSFTLVPSGTAGDAGKPVVQLVGESRPTNTPATPAFCANVTSFGTAAEALTDLLSKIVINDPSTYPTDTAVLTAAGNVADVIASGDMNVPAAIKPQWEVLTGGLRTLVASLQLVGGDVAGLGANLAVVVAGINSPVEDPETAAATTVLTNWYISNCIAAPTPSADPATPKFTG